MPKPTEVGLFEKTNDNAVEPMYCNVQSKNLISDTAKLADSVGFELLGTDLGKDVKSALRFALTAKTIFPKVGNPLSIFRDALYTTIRAIETHHRGSMFQEFLLKGPYEDTGPIPKELISQRLSDNETASVITFIYSHMVNCFKGAVTELLATAACSRLLKQLRSTGQLPENAWLYVGDSVGVHRLGGKGLLKGADLHILIKEDERPKAAPCIIVAGVAEVKSYFRSERRMNEQLDKHIRRAKRGLEVTGENYSAERVNIGFGPNRRVVRIAVLPSEWALPRTFKFKSSKNGRVLNVEKGVPHCKSDEIREIGRDVWRITLRWSKEALAAVAYEMTFWYMDKVGEVIYGKQRPKAWGKMSPGEAGRNAAKMMLYYALLRCGSDRESERAIALYNSYGFGYALGMNYRNEKGKREMLWPQDLDEILSSGKNKYGCSIR